MRDFRRLRRKEKRFWCAQEDGHFQIAAVVTHLYKG